MPSTTARPLPTRAEVDLADYKLGSFASDLDHLRSTVAACDGDTISVSEYLYREAEAIELPELPNYNPAELAYLVVFAADVLAEVEKIGEDARAIQEVARHLYHECGYDDEAQRALVREWHEAALGEGGGDA